MFTIRVYGILLRDGRVLVTDEFRLGILMTKFPGGGLEFGEGPAACLKREWLEETGEEIRVVSHYYTTDFFQPSYHLPESTQVINIYYLVEPIEESQMKISGKKFDFEEVVDGAQSFRWLDLGAISPEDFTLPIDKVLATKLKEDFLSGSLH